MINLPLSAVMNVLDIAGSQIDELSTRLEAYYSLTVEETTREGRRASGDLLFLTVKSSTMLVTLTTDFRGGDHGLGLGNEVMLKHAAYALHFSEEVEEILTLVAELAHLYMFTRCVTEARFPKRVCAECGREMFDHECGDELPEERVCDECAGINSQPARCTADVEGGPDRCEDAGCSVHGVEAMPFAWAEPESTFTLIDAGPAHDTEKRRGSRTIYVDGPNGRGDLCSGVDITGPDRDAIASLLLSTFGADEVKPETDDEREARMVAEILGLNGVQ